MSYIGATGLDENQEQFDILKDETIPFEERKELARSVLTKYLNLKTPSGRRNFALRVFFVIHTLTKNRRPSFFL